MPVNLVIMADAPGGVTPLTSGQVTPTESLGSHQYKIYSAQQTGSIANFITATKDWVTQCDMIVMYSGPTCGQKLPDINDYNAIKADIVGTGKYYTLTGKVFNGYTFYYRIQGLNQSISLNGAPSGCYYVYIYNTSNIRGFYMLSWRQYQ